MLHKQVDVLVDGDAAVIVGRACADGDIVPLRKVGVVRGGDLVWRDGAVVLFAVEDDDARLQEGIAGKQVFDEERAHAFKLREDTFGAAAAAVGDQLKVFGFIDRILIRGGEQTGRGSPKEK